LVKDGNLDIEAANTHIENSIKDEGWKTTFKKIIADCQQTVSTTEVDAMQMMVEDPPCSFNKESCDVRFTFISSCITLRTLIVNIISRD